MRYGQAISSAFTSLKSGPLWGFAISLYAAITALYVVLIGGAVGLARPARLVGDLRNLDSANAGAFLGAIALVASATLLAVALTIPLSLILHGGMIHLADEVLVGRRVTVGQGWAFGARRIGRTFAIDLAVGLISLAAMIVAVVPFILVVVALAAGSDSGSPGAGAIVGICFGYLVFIVFAVAVSLLTSAYEAIAIRYGLVGTRSAGDALGAGWQAFKARWKNVVVFSLIVLGLQWAFSTMTSMITVPLQFFVIPSEFTVGGGTPSIDQLPVFLTGYAILIAVSVVLAVPWTVFNCSLWGAFFRQLTGLDVVAAPPIPATAIPAAPAQPAATIVADQPDADV